MGRLIALSLAAVISSIHQVRAGEPADALGKPLLDFVSAEELCRYFIPHSATEFAASNVKRTLLCLSPGSRIAAGLSIERGTFSLVYKSPTGTNLVTVEFDEDRKIGGMALRVVSRGE